MFYTLLSVQATLSLINESFTKIFLSSLLGLQARLFGEGRAWLAGARKPILNTTPPHRPRERRAAPIHALLPTTPVPYYTASPH
jgi:hypothetical protein